MKTKIQKWGNSLGVRIPNAISKQKALRDGLGVSVLLKNNQIVIEPLSEDITLDSLLAQVTDQNRHTEIDWSDARGNEIW